MTDYVPELQKLSVCIQTMCVSDSDRIFAMNTMKSMFAMLAKYKESSKILDLLFGKGKMKDPILDVLPILTTLLSNKQMRKDYGAIMTSVVKHNKDKTDKEIQMVVECFVKNCKLTTEQVKCIVSFGEAVLGFMNDPSVAKPMKDIFNAYQASCKRMLKTIDGVEKKKPTKSKRK